MKAKIIIGANFGDEGKGMMTEYFAWKAKESKESVCVIKHNGGAQAGHTVETKNGERFIFHHFGAGTTINVPTYLTEDFIVNPILFKKEYIELKEKGLTPEIYINKNAIFTTPVEMIINQTIEQARGSAKHGSCGIGIFETVKRSEMFPIKLKEIRLSSHIKNIIDDICNEWLPLRIKEHGIFEMKDWIVEDVNKMLASYIDDFEFMLNHSKLVDDDFIEPYQNLIFETAQGLMLDQNNMEYFPHLTPSNTGSKNPSKYLKNLNVDIEIIYVTRTYLTRHGAGMFKTECSKDNINSSMYDKTNVPNPFQDTLRYGYMNLEDLDKRITDDSKNIPNAKISIAATHLNETDGCFISKDEKILVNEHPLVRYVSCGKTKENINEL